MMIATSHLSIFYRRKKISRYHFCCSVLNRADSYFVCVCALVYASKHIQHTYFFPLYSLIHSLLLHIQSVNDFWFSSISQFHFLFQDVEISNQWTNIFCIDHSRLCVCRILSYPLHIYTRSQFIWSFLPFFLVFVSISLEFFFCAFFWQIFNCCLDGSQLVQKIQMMMECVGKRPRGDGGRGFCFILSCVEWDSYFCFKK